jgi:anti-anti-sigma factor
MSNPEPVGDIADEPILTLRDPVEIGPERWRLAPVGEIDMSNADSLMSACDELVERSGLKLEVDLEGLTYIDSSGIGALVELLRLLESRGGSMRITNPSGIVERVLDLSGLLPLLGDQPT